MNVFNLYLLLSAKLKTTACSVQIITLEIMDCSTQKKQSKKDHTFQACIIEQDFK